MNRRARLILMAAVLVAPLTLATIARGEGPSFRDEEAGRWVEKTVPGFRCREFKQAGIHGRFRFQAFGTDAEGHPVTVVIANSWLSVIRIETKLAPNPVPQKLIPFSVSNPKLWEKVGKVVRVTDADGQLQEWRLVDVDPNTGKEKSLAVVDPKKPVKR